MLLLNKNLYYDRICPFGAAQDCLAAIGGTKRQVRDKRNLIRWIPRILALSLLTLGLIFSHPSSINYEVFSAFFQNQTMELYYCNFYSFFVRPALKGQLMTHLRQIQEG